MKPKLDQLVPHSEQAKIEATLAKKVPPPPSPAEVEAHDLAYQRRMRKDHGLRKTSPGRYLDWPKGTKGVPPRPRFRGKPFARDLAAAAGTSP